MQLEREDVYIYIYMYTLGRSGSLQVQALQQQSLPSAEVDNIYTKLQHTSQHRPVQTKGAPRLPVRDYLCLYTGHILVYIITCVHCSNCVCTNVPGIHVFGRQNKHPAHPACTGQLYSDYD